MSCFTGNVRTRGYLSYTGPPGRAGMNHRIRNLECLLREAHGLGRAVVLPPLDLHLHHNFGFARVWSWDDYFDLDASRLVDAAGVEHRLPLAGRPPAALPVVRLRATTTVPDAQAAPLVERRMAGSVYGREVRLPARASATLRLRPAARVLELAEPVLARLRLGAPDGFAALHVRRGDRLRYAVVARRTRPEAVGRRLAGLGIRGGAVFVLSDERDPSWWAALTRRVEVVRSGDFPVLTALTAPDAPGGPDNYLLYEVEKEVFRHARIRVETLPGEYEPANARLVPRWAWALARPAMARYAAVRHLRRLLGERAWRALRGPGGSP